MDHLLQLAHGFPQLLPLYIDSSIVFVQLFLARREPFQDCLNVPLCRGVAVKIPVQLIPERNDAKQLAPAQFALAARIKVFDCFAQIHQIIAYAGFLIHRADGTIKETVGHGRCCADLFLTHTGDLIDFLAKGW